MNNDLISRSALLDAMCKTCTMQEVCEKSYNETRDFIQSIPAVDAEPVRHGRWENIGYITTAYGSIDTGCCSECGAVDVPIEPYDDYCPHCGAMMTRTYGGEE